MNNHTRAILAAMTPEDRKFFQREPGRSWVAQMHGRLAAMSVPEAVKMLRAEIPVLAKPAARAPATTPPADGLPAPVAPLTTRDR